MSGQRYFLTLSNVRTASTHLITSFSVLPSTYADREIKWRRENPAPAHINLDTDRPDFTETLSVLDGKAKIVGSKFILDPRGELLAGDAGKLTRALKCFAGAGGRVAHLTRPYFDICASSLMRGNWNSLARDMEGMSEVYRSALSVREQDLKKTRPDIEKGSVQGLRFGKMYQMLVGLLLNDCIYARMTRDIGEVSEIRYARFDEDTRAFAKTLDLPEPDLEALEAQLENPIIRKLSGLNTEDRPNVAAFRALCAYADVLRERVVRRELEPGDIFNDLERESGRQVSVSHPIFHRVFKDIRQSLQPA